ncbi:MAG: transposase, partial [Lentisphaeria bacterium]|nr:transposase [Lentisphaeria bacterium]
CYLALGKTDNKRQLAYRALFDETISLQTLEEIRDALNKAWVLGDDGFKEQIEKQTGRRVSPIKRGGDRKSEGYREEFKYL